MRTRLTPFVLVALLSVGTGFGIWLGLAQSPNGVPSSKIPAHSSNPGSAVTSPTGPTTSPSSSPPQLEEIAFFNLTTGYGLFSSEAEGVCQTLIGHTHDGGAHFTELQVVATWSCDQRPPVRSLAFDDHGDGFAYGPGLIETHDGGHTWSNVAQSGPVLAVSALGYSIWMLEDGCPLQQGPVQTPCPLRVMQSANGGSSWSPAPTEPPAVIDAGSAAMTGQSWLVRVSQTAAYVVSTPTPLGNARANSAAYWFTNDGGSSWSSGQIPCGIGGFYTELSVAPGGTLVSVCAGQPGAGSQQKSVSISHDGGHSWAVENPCSKGIGQCVPESPLNTGYLGAVDATSATTAFVYGNRSILLVTHDGGLHWQRTEVSDGAGGPFQVIFFNQLQGVAIGEANTPPVYPFAVWHTTDGGMTWTAVVPSAG